MNKQRSPLGRRSIVRAAALLLVTASAGAWTLHAFRHEALGAGEGPATAAAPAAQAAGNDWIGFHDGGSLAGVAPKIKAPPLNLRWTFQTQNDNFPAQMLNPAQKQPNNLPPGNFEGGAAIVGGLVFVADTSGALRALDAQNGQVKWKVLSDDGFETTPLVINGRVFIGDMGGTFYAFSADTGKLLWSFATGSEIHCSANYLGADRSRIIFGTDGADVFCLEAATGKVIWNQKAQAQVYGTPGVANGSVLVSGCDAQLRGMDGKNGNPTFSVDLGAPCAGSAAVINGSMVVGTDQGRVMSISATTQKQNWLFSGVNGAEWVYSSPAVSDGVVVFGARDRSVYGLDFKTGNQLWTFATRGDVDSSPVISDGRVYVGSKDKKLYVLDLKTGKELWFFTTHRGIAGSPAIGNGIVVIGDSAGNLFCLE